MAVRAQPSTTDFREALRQRLISAVDGLLDGASRAAVSDAIAAPTGYGALARLLSVLPDVHASAAVDDPLVAAQARTALWRQAYAARTPLLDAGDVMLLLGMTSTEALRKRDRAGTIIALPLGTGRFTYPSWQFVDGSVIPGLAAVRKALGDPASWAYAGQLDTLRDPSHESAPTLRELLLSGNVAQAVVTATASTQSGGA